MCRWWGYEKRRWSLHPQRYLWTLVIKQLNNVINHTKAIAFISWYCLFSSNSECINGTHTCFVNYTVNDNGQLSNSSLENLKNQLIQVFNFQFNHKEHLQVDIRHINKYPTHGKHCTVGCCYYFCYYERGSRDILLR